MASLTNLIEALYVWMEGAHSLYEKAVNAVVPFGFDQSHGIYRPRNDQRYHESLNNFTPADVYFGRDKAILRERKKIKKQIIQQRHLQHQKQAA
jgi:hypothetical protein